VDENGRFPSSNHTTQDDGFTEFRADSVINASGDVHIYVARHGHRYRVVTAAGSAEYSALDAENLHSFAYSEPEYPHRAGPTPRGSPRMAFDERTVILFGGRVRTPDGVEDVADTWKLDGERWLPRAIGAVPQSCPPLRDADRVRLAAAFEIAAQSGDSLWPGWTATPFSVLLVAGEHEYLLRHPRPSDDFVVLAQDSLLGTAVRCRPRQHAPNLLATFPAVGGVPTVVIGTPEATGTGSTAWVLTLLHEYFHAYQYSQPGYYDGVNALGLSGGDQTGMWMLNYPFPYDSALVAETYAEASRALVHVLRNPAANREAWPAARARLDALLADSDRRYLDFQAWQEGIARYTEYRMGRLAAAAYEPSAALRAVPDYVSFGVVADSVHARMLAHLEEPRLAERRRVAFYALGAGLGLLFDRVGPEWRERYFVRRFALGDR
jgi:hypothetical protein